MFLEDQVSFSLNLPVISSFAGVSFVATVGVAVILLTSPPEALFGCKKFVCPVLPSKSSRFRILPLLSLEVTTTRYSSPAKIS